MKHIVNVVALAASIFGFGSTLAQAEITECTEITSLPTIITAQGVYCLKGNLNTAITSGDAILIDTNNVTIDLNGWKLGGLAAGLGTQANGIAASGRKNIIIRNGTIRGFYRGLEIIGTGSSGHRVEDLVMDGNTHRAIDIEGDGVRILNNSIVNTGPGDVSNQAVGIRVNNGSGGIINGNLINGLEETAQIYGIRLENTIEFEVSDNTIFGIGEGTAEAGIIVVSGNKTAIFDNTAVNEFSSAIRDGGVSSDNTLCVNNRVRGNTADPVICDIEANNEVF
ncbi:MAG: hypothetical protein QNJ29_09285 [Rhizobiaceae bacterium]|nr:hypothetical protein [Rhizobiaceae bacterium]